MGSVERLGVTGGHGSSRGGSCGRSPQPEPGASFTLKTLELLRVRIRAISSGPRFGKAGCKQLCHYEWRQEGESIGRYDMRFNLRRRLAVALSAAACVLAASTGPAAADDEELWIDPEVVPGTPVVQGSEFDQFVESLDTPDEVPGASVAAASCWSWYAGYAPPFKYATYKWLDCSLAGSTGYQKPYSWTINPGSSGKACGQGMGYNSSSKVIWRSLGCGGSGNAKVPWGKRLSIPKYKTTSQILPLGAPTLWV